MELSPNKLLQRTFEALEVMKNPQFEVGREYHRRADIHEVFGGQRYGGISTPRDALAIFIFTSGAGEQHGYIDKYRDDGLFEYTGEGQVGPMTMDSGNSAILNHVANKKALHIFESTRSSYVRYLGSAECLGYHEDIRPDREGTDRTVFIFHLSINSDPSTNEAREPSSQYDKPDASKLKRKPLAQLRAAALAQSPSTATLKQKRELTFYRSQALKLYVVARSHGRCEGCGEPAPFSTKSGPYLECHHVHRLADGGPDHPRNVVALCPNCHRRAHYAQDAVAFNKQLINVAEKVESSDF